MNRHETPTVLSEALAYAMRGWYVFPINRGTKVACVSGANSNGRRWGNTRDEGEIRAYWLKWPDANVGIETGPDSGIFVIDVDSVEGHGKDGLANFEELQDRHGRVPPTLTAKSPTGGTHYYFRYPTGMVVTSNSDGKLAPGIDVKGRAGVILAPPSLNKHGKPYEWVNDLPIADPPQWLLDLVKMRERPPRPANASSGTEPADLSKIRDALFKIDLDWDDWSDWNKVGMMLFAGTGGSDEGLKLFKEWSSKSEKYDESNTEEKWGYFVSCPPTEIGIGTLFFLAREAEDRRRAEQIARNIEIGDGITEPIFPTIMTLAEMQERLVFVGAIGGVVDRATGRIRKKEHAIAEYAASMHRYANRAGDVKEIPALKAWISSRQRVSVDTLAWVPGSPQICRPPEADDGSKTAFNSWHGIAPMSYPSDWAIRAKPFFEHVEYLVPIKEERERFTQWLAHIYQHPEVLPHTYHLMMTKTTGIGRNLLASIIVRTLRGHVAAGVSLSDILDGAFNGRLSQKLLAIVDEAKEGSGDKRYVRAEALKRIVTEEHRHINRKYGLQSVEKNCCRWLMFSNHQDAIPFDNTDRRADVHENPTERQGPAYYEKLFGLLDDPAFIGSVRHSLETLDISSFKPGAHAPMNEAKRKALYAMLTETERAVSEFMEDCEKDLTTRTAIRGYVRYCTHGEVNEGHLTHAITRAGMKNTSRRVKAEATGAKRHSVVIVKGAWTPEIVKGAADATLIEAIGPLGFTEIS